MARSRPKWWDAALPILLQGGHISDAARAANKRRETVSRALAKPDSAFSKELAQLRAAATSVTVPTELVEKAQRVLAEHLDSEDPRAAFSAAKVVVGKLAPQQPAEPEPVAEEISAEQAVKEIALALPVLKVLMREHPEAFSPETVEELKAGCRKLVADLDEVLGAPTPSAPPASPAAPPSPPPPRLLN